MDLTNTRIQNTYGGVMNVGATGFNENFQQITDGFGTPMPIEASTSGVNFTGNIYVNGVTGLIGSSGTSGSSGSSGENGATGPIGATGATGADGISSGKNYYFNIEEYGGVTGYHLLSTQPNRRDQATLNLTLSGGATGYIDQFITGQLGFTTIPAGVQDFSIFLLMDSANADMDAYAELELANSAGVGYGTTIRTNTQKIDYVEASTPTRVELTSVFNETAINATDRMIVRLVVHNQDATSRTATLYSQGNAFYSFVNTSIGVTTSKFVSNENDTYTSTAAVQYVITLTQAEYDAIPSPQANTLYIVI